MSTQSESCPLEESACFVTLLGLYLTNKTRGGKREGEESSEEDEDCCHQCFFFFFFFLGYSRSRG